MISLIAAVALASSARAEQPLYNRLLGVFMSQQNRADVKNFLADCDDRFSAEQKLDDEPMADIVPTFTDEGIDLRCEGSQTKHVVFAYNSELEAAQIFWGTLSYTVRNCSESCGPQRDFYRAASVALSVLRLRRRAEAARENLDLSNVTHSNITNQHLVILAARSLDAQSQISPEAEALAAIFIRSVNSLPEDAQVDKNLNPPALGIGAVRMERVQIDSTRHAVVLVTGTHEYILAARSQLEKCGFSTAGAVLFFNGQNASMALEAAARKLEWTLEARIARASLEDSLKKLNGIRDDLSESAVRASRVFENVDAWNQRGVVPRY